VSDSVKWIKAAAALTVLAVVFFVVAGWMNDYRDATQQREVPQGESPEATETAEPSGESTEPAQASGSDKADAPVVLVVKIDGLNFRKQPKSDGAPIRGLKQGEKITLIGEEGSWLVVKDSKGVKGYISSNPQYTEEQ